ncbi:c-type cytochrome [Maricaulis sp. CAU 1757]
MAAFRMRGVMCAAALLGPMLVAACTDVEEAAQWPIPTDDPAVLTQGAELYRAHCASCHGAELEGQPDWRTRRPDGRLPAPPHDVTGHTWHHPDAVLFEITKLGTEAVTPPGYESDMPGFAEQLSDAEIRTVLAYIKSTWPAEIRARQDAMSQPVE